MYLTDLNRTIAHFNQTVSVLSATDVCLLPTNIEVIVN